MPFNPDSYLAEKTSSGGTFNPDSYISEKQSGTPSQPQQSAPQLDLGMRASTGSFNPNPPNIIPQSLPEIPHATGQQAGNAVTEKLAESIGATGHPYLGALAGTAAYMIPTAAQMLMTPDIPVPKMFSRSAPEVPNILQSIGGRGINESAGIQAGTLGKLAGKMNPTEAGANLGMTLSKEGVTGATSGEIFSNAVKMRDQFGKGVGDAISQIKSQGIPTTINAEQALQPLLDDWMKYSGGSLTATKSMAKPFEQVYGSLAEIGSKNNGQIGMDEIMGAMDEVGSTMSKMKPENPRYAALSSLYGSLARAKDNIVKTISEAVQNPSLRDSLLKSNAGYSRYMTLMPDIKRKSLQEGVTGIQILAHPVKFLRESTQPFLSRGALGLGNAASKIGEHLPTVKMNGSLMPISAKVETSVNPPTDQETPDMSKDNGSPVNPPSNSLAPHGNKVSQDGKIYVWNKSTGQYEEFNPQQAQYSGGQ